MDSCVGFVCADDRPTGLTGRPDINTATEPSWLELRLQQIIVRSVTQFAAHCCVEVALHWTEPVGKTPPAIRVSTKLFRTVHTHGPILSALQRDSVRILAVHVSAAMFSH